MPMGAKRRVKESTSRSINISEYFPCDQDPCDPWDLKNFEAWLRAHVPAQFDRSRNLGAAGNAGRGRLRPNANRKSHRSAA